MSIELERRFQFDGDKELGILGIYASNELEQSG